MDPAAACHQLARDDLNTSTMGGVTYLIGFAVVLGYRAWPRWHRRAPAARIGTRHSGLPGQASLRSNGPAAQRLTAMRSFSSFVLAELPALILRWHMQHGPGWSAAVVVREGGRHDQPPTGGEAPVCGARRWPASLARGFHG